MKKIYYVTSNPGKAEILNSIVKDLNPNLKIEQHDYDYPEYKHDDKIETVALEGAKHCAEKLQKEIIVTDAGLFIEELNGFPGINTAFVLKRIGIDGILKLMHGKENRNAKFKVALAYCAPGKKPELFYAETPLVIAEEARGEKGFGFDPIMIPVGFDETLSENIEIRDKVLGYRPAFEKFIRWYNERV